MTVSKVKLTDLPVPVQAHILSMLSPSPLPVQSVKPSIDDVVSLTDELPRDFLSVSKTCRALAQAAIMALGPRAVSLNNATAEPLWEWIAAFGKAVKAVSLYGNEVDRCDFLTILPLIRPDLAAKANEHAMKTFVALSRENIQLEVLDVKTVHFNKVTYPELMQQKLVDALQRSSSTLRELSLRITPICTNAVASVTLPSLRVVEAQLNEVAGKDEIITAKKGQCAQACMDLLRALHGHADRKAKKTTLHELRLLSFSEAPCTTDNETCSSLFQSVQVLDLRSISYNRRNDGNVAKFITLFTNLRLLHWNGSPPASGFHLIRSKCHALQEVHHHPYVRYTPTADMLEAGENPMTVKNLLTSYGEKLRSLEIQAKLSPAQLKIFGENNPAVEHVAMEIDKTNVGALSLFLGTHCRKLRCLKLSFVPYAREALGEVGWDEFSKGIQSASEELCELSIFTRHDRHPSETAHHAMVQSTLDIIESLGKHVQRFCLAVPMRTPDLKVQYDALCRIIKSCVTFAKDLEKLCVRIDPVGSRVGFQDRREESSWTMKLVHEIERLVKLPHLNELDLGRWHDRAEAPTGRREDQ